MVMWIRGKLDRGSRRKWRNFSRGAGLGLRDECGGILEFVRYLGYDGGYNYLYYNGCFL